MFNEEEQKNEEGFEDREEIKAEEKPVEEEPKPDTGEAPDREERRRLRKNLKRSR